MLYPLSYEGGRPEQLAYTDPLGHAYKHTRYGHVLRSWHDCSSAFDVIPRHFPA